MLDPVKIVWNFVPYLSPILSVEFAPFVPCTLVTEFSPLNKTFLVFLILNYWTLKIQGKKRQKIGYLFAMYTLCVKN